jgi:hypothetical protein
MMGVVGAADLLTDLDPQDSAIDSPVIAFSGGNTIDLEV